MRHVVIGQRAIKRILPRDERSRNVIPARGRLGSIEAAVIRGPVRVPGTLVIRDRIISAGLLANPKNRRHDVRLPRIARGRAGPGSGRDKHLRLDFQ